MEIVVAQATFSQGVNIRSLDQTAKRTNLGEAGVIKQKDDHIGRVFRRPLFGCPPLFGIRIGAGDLAAEFRYAV